MANTATFGDEVLADAQKLRESGLDANQIAGVLCKKDARGRNYGIGILLGADGKPMPTSPTLLDYVVRELRDSGSGSYINSQALSAGLLESVLRWQGVAEKYWPHFQLLLPSDAGTGAVQTAIQAAILLNDKVSALSVQELSWPAYKALASTARLGFREYASEGVSSGEGVLPLYQAGPHNMTGRVPSPEVVKARAEAAGAAGISVVLDRAYPGFEYARRLAATSYGEIMRESFRAQVEPFMEAGVPFALAVSPTKAFVTFALRPCGLLLVFHPDKRKAESMGPGLAGLIRARGSSFEHPITRAFVKALVKDRQRLEDEHAGALARNAAAERGWQAHAKGTPIEALFSDAYAGLFRNPKALPDAAREIYGARLYPVFANGRCRVNVTGLPGDAQAAASDVSVFARYCEAD